MNPRLIPLLLLLLALAGCNRPIIASRPASAPPGVETADAGDAEAAGTAAPGTEDTATAALSPADMLAKLQETERRAQEAERRAQAAEQELKILRARALEFERQAREAERSTSEKRSEESFSSQALLSETERRAREAELRVIELERRLSETEIRAMEAERRALGGR